MSTPNFSNPLTGLDRERLAIKHAKEILESRGEFYPVFNSTLSAEVNHQKLCDYAAKESKLVVDFLRNGMVVI